MKALLAAGCVLLASGCSSYRTVYRHLQPTGPLTSPATLAATDSTEPQWQDFFLWGLVPSERTIDAAARCGGADRVEEIRTEHSWAQRVVASFAEYHDVNIYSPYTGTVVCRRDVR